MIVAGDAAMSSDSKILGRSSDPRIVLDFEMSTADWGDYTMEARHPKYMTILGAAMIMMAAYNAGVHSGVNKTGSFWFMELSFLVQIIMGWGFVTNNSLIRWLTRKMSKGITRTRLELDALGVRGTFEMDSPCEKRPATKRINYVWRQVRKIHHPADCVVLEFHGGGTVTIPDIQFDTLIDLQQCLDWAEQSLAEQRDRKRTYKPTAA
jgi:hypothetical protein